MKTETGGPAFPIENKTKAEQYGANGMTLRDYFAAKAMQAEMQIDPETNSNTVAARAYTQADAMLEARK